MGLVPALQMLKDYRQPVRAPWLLSEPASSNRARTRLNLLIRPTS